MKCLHAGKKGTTLGTLQLVTGGDGMSIVQVTTLLAFVLVLLLRIALLVVIVAVIVGIVRILREPRYVPPDETKRRPVAVAGK